MSKNNLRLKVSDLVWSKFENYPYWPSIVIDISEIQKEEERKDVLSHKKNNDTLIKFLGDETFYWFSQKRDFEKQNLKLCTLNSIKQFERGNLQLQGDEKMKFEIGVRILKEKWKILQQQKKIKKKSTSSSSKTSKTSKTSTTKTTTTTTQLKNKTKQKKNSTTTGSSSLSSSSSSVKMKMSKKLSSKLSSISSKKTTTVLKKRGRNNDNDNDNNNNKDNDKKNKNENENEGEKSSKKRKITTNSSSSSSTNNSSTNKSNKSKLKEAMKTATSSKMKLNNSQFQKFYEKIELIFKNLQNNKNTKKNENNLNKSLKMFHNSFYVESDLIDSIPFISTLKSIQTHLKNIDKTSQTSNTKSIINIIPKIITNLELEKTKSKKIKQDLLLKNEKKTPKTPKTPKSPKTPLSPKSPIFQNENSKKEINEIKNHFTKLNQTQNFGFIEESFKNKRKKVNVSLATIYFTNLKYDEKNVTVKDAIEFGIKLEEEIFKSNRQNEKSYFSKFFSIKSNLGNKKNKDFRGLIFEKIIQVDEICTMKSHEMASKQQKNKRKEALQRFQKDRELVQPTAAVSDMFQCGKCKSKKCSYYQMQTRSADEPMTIFVTCTHCQNRWRQ